LSLARRRSTPGQRRPSPPSDALPAGSERRPLQLRHDPVEQRAVDLLRRRGFLKEGPAPPASRHLRGLPLERGGLPAPVVDRREIKHHHGGVEPDLVPGEKVLGLSKAASTTSPVANAATRGGPGPRGETSRHAPERSHAAGTASRDPAIRRAHPRHLQLLSQEEVSSDRIPWHTEERKSRKGAGETKRLAVHEPRAPFQAGHRAGRAWPALHASRTRGCARLWSSHGETPGASLGSGNWRADSFARPIHFVVALYQVPARGWVSHSSHLRGCRQLTSSGPRR
jgi:hypothetical protein